MPSLLFSMHALSTSPYARPPSQPRPLQLPSLLPMRALSTSPRCAYTQVRREVQATLHAGFKDWLQRTGNARQITDLMAMQTW